MVALGAARASNDAADLTGKHALVVGGTSGCGKGVALVLSRRGCSVTLVGRDAERAAEAAKQIQEASPSDCPCEFIQCDVRSFASIKQACNAFAASHDSLDILSLSCTRGGIQGYRPTAEGFDERLMTMYLGRFAWVHCLLPLLQRSECGGRVLSILSAGHHQPHTKWGSDFLTVGCGMVGRTHAAGFYSDCAVLALAALHPSLTFVHIFPGFVNTNWYLELPTGIRCLTRLAMKGGGKSLEDCGEWMAFPLLHPDHARGGFLLTEHAEREKPTKLSDSETCAAIWQKSVEVFRAQLG
jgi:NAD(P)-dependent dehydrogenase (short-subunit alcohol dehydrogenase family)